MDNPKNKKLSSHLVLTALLTGSITITLSLIYILLSIVVLILRVSNCQIPTNGATYFWTTIANAYIIDETTCPRPTDITQTYTVFVLTAITLSVSVLCLVAASFLVAIVQNEQSARYLNHVVSAYIGTWVASLVVDITTATHFGIDHSTLTATLASLEVSPPSIGELYATEVLRLGAFLLMTIALKGYVALLINLILIILLVIYVLEHRKLLKSNEHSIHKMGVLTAFDRPRKPEDNSWATQPEPAFSPFARGAQVNNGFNDNESDRSPRRQPTRSDFNYSNSSYDRSDSWHRSQPNLAQSARPFSYLEDIKRPGPARPTPSPAVETPWNREPWQQGPPVPMPDYSPQPRRLKSVLKPGYI